MLSLATGVAVNMLGAGGFNPLSLFAQGQQGVWYDPSDFSTMFQDSAGTTPVTAVGQPVGKLLDKSGRGNHAIQATAANRPVLQQDANGMFYLAFNGTNSALATAASVDFTGTAQVSMFSGLYKASDSLFGIALEFSVNAMSNNGAFLNFAPQSNATPNVDFLSRGTGFVHAIATPYAAPIAMVTTGLADISAPFVKVRINGTEFSSVSTQGTGNYGNYPLYIGARAGTGNFFNGRIYSLIVRGATSSAAEIAGTENWVNGKTRAY